MATVSVTNRRKGVDDKGKMITRAIAVNGLPSKLMGGESVQRDGMV